MKMACEMGVELGIAVPETEEGVISPILHFRKDGSWVLWPKRVHGTFRKAIMVDEEKFDSLAAALLRIREIMSAQEIDMGPRCIGIPTLPELTTSALDRFIEIAGGDVVAVSRPKDAEITSEVED